MHEFDKQAVLEIHNFFKAANPSNVHFALSGVWYQTACERQQQKWRDCLGTRVPAMLDHVSGTTPGFLLQHLPRLYLC